MEARIMEARIMEATITAFEPTLRPRDRKPSGSIASCRPSIAAVPPHAPFAQRRCLNANEALE